MKTSYIIFFALMICSHICSGQKLQLNAVAHSDHATFKTAGDAAKPNGVLYAYNAGNKLYGKHSKLGQTAISYWELNDQKSLNDIMIDVFGIQRLKALLPEKLLGIDYYVDVNGKVLELAFMTQKNTSITANELERLEQELKKYTAYKLLPKETKGGDFFVITRIARYQQIINQAKVQ